MGERKIQPPGQRKNVPAQDIGRSVLVACFRNILKKYLGFM
jgi:hypothetical protein